jgi:hypothetical protein
MKKKLAIAVLISLGVLVISVNVYTISEIFIDAYKLAGKIGILAAMISISIVIGLLYSIIKVGKLAINQLNT